MLLNLRKYYRPRSIEAAVRLLSANPGRCRVLAGGTYLLSRADRDVEEVVDIAALKLRVMKQDEELIRVGATVTLQLMIDNPRLKKFAGGIVVRASRRSAVSEMIRNQRTVGGEICAVWNQSDLCAVLLALDARVKLVNFSMEEKEMSLPDFWSMLAKPRTKKDRAIPFSGLLEEILIPRRTRSLSAAFESVSQIESQPSLICAAAVLEFGEDQSCSAPRIVLGSYGEKPFRLTAAEAHLQGKILSSECIEAASRLGWDDVQPMSDVRASADYRRAVAPALLRQVLIQCAKGK